MTAATLTHRRLVALLHDASPDLEALGTLGRRIDGAVSGDGATLPPAARAAVLAVALHAYYGAAEALFLRVVRTLDGSIPEGPDWHRDLLARVSRPFGGLRPRLIGPESSAALRRLLAFRHFFRHAYAAELDLDLLLGQARSVLQQHHPLMGELDLFVEHLRATADAAACGAESIE